PFSDRHADVLEPGARQSMESPPIALISLDQESLLASTVQKSTDAETAAAETTFEKTPGSQSPWQDATNRDECEWSSDLRPAAAFS
ncbi:MAG TPA: hypothetical protein VHY56_13645, partial [Candidatus Binataceae bacterium]|nr:hypothetical protein [Candidatus Binataceae bacterium]